MIDLGDSSMKLLLVILKSEFYKYSKINPMKYFFVELLVCISLKI